MRSYQPGSHFPSGPSSLVIAINGSFHGESARPQQVGGSNFLVFLFAVAGCSTLFYAVAGENFGSNRSNLR